MVNLKRDMTYEWLNERKNNLFLPKIMTYLQHLRVLVTSLQCLKLDLRRSNPRPRPRRDFGVTKPRLRKTCLETCLEVSTSVNIQ